MVTATQSERLGRARARLSLVIALGAVLAGCASTPAIETSRTRAEVLRPIGLSDVKDGRARFRAIFCALTSVRGRTLPDYRPCDEALVQLNDEGTDQGGSVNTSAARLPLTLVFVSGIFGECLSKWVSPFSDSYGHLQALGYQTKLIVASGRSSAAANAEQIDRFLTDSLGEDDRDVVLVGYSKGAVDLLETLDRHPDASWRSRIRALVSVAGPINGSPLADQFAPLYDSLLARVPLTACPPGDGLGLDSLSRRERLDALARERLPRDVLYLSLVATPVADNVNSLLIPFRGALSKIDPRNDGQVLAYDAILPGATLLGFANADHWAVALPLDRIGGPFAAVLSNNNAFPRQIFAESIAKYVEEALIASRMSH